MSNTIPTVKVTARFVDQLGAPVCKAVVTMRLTTTERYAGYIVPREARAVTDAMGVAVLQVWPNELGTESSEYAVSVTFPDACAANSSIAPMRSIRGNCVVPNADCNLQDIMELPAYEPRSAGQAVETEVAHWASLAAQYSEGARASMQGAQSVETRLNATADVASASRLAAQEAAQSASASATRAKNLVDGVSSTISHFQNSVVEQTAETVERLTVDATTSIGQHKASAIDEIGAKVEATMDESIATLTQARSESMQAVTGAKQAGLDQISTAGATQLLALRNEAALFGEDFENLTERAESAAKKAGCSSAAAANAESVATSAASRAESAAQGLERHRDDALSAATRAVAAAQTVDAAANTATAKATLAVNAAAEVATARQAISQSEQSAAASAQVATAAKNATAANAEAVSTATANMEQSIAAAAGKLVNEDVVNAAVSQATSAATTAATTATNAATSAGQAASAVETHAAEVATATARVVDIAGQMTLGLNVEKSTIEMAASVIRLTNHSTQLQVDNLTSSVSGVDMATELARLSGRVTRLELQGAS